MKLPVSSETGSIESLDEQVVMNHGMKNHYPLFYPFKHSGYYMYT
jgi:hypothetical protein